GPLPGTQVRGHFRVPGLGPVRYARRLVATGSGTRRTVLLIARGKRGELCFTAVAGGRVRRARFTCMKRWDRPPLLVRAGVGGSRKPVHHWMSLVGLVRSDVQQVVVQSQQGGDPRYRPRLQAWPGFPWKAFGTQPAFRHHFPNQVWAEDANRIAIQDIDLGWVYGPACGDGRGIPPCTARRRHSGPWSAVRDSLAERQSSFVRRTGGVQAKQLAFDHPVLRAVVAGQPFSIDGVAEWSTCKGRRLGAVIEVRLSRSVLFEADVPVKDQDDTSRSAYLEGVAHMRIENAISFHVYVDLNRSKVVAIGSGLTPPDLTGRRPPRPRLTEFKLLTGLHPAGGPNPGKCEPHRD
ncbi:MAG: hypothetical protein ACRDLQ_09835, partial [Solirubrobacterales bacterium]